MRTDLECLWELYQPDRMKLLVASLFWKGDLEHLLKPKAAPNHFWLLLPFRLHITNTVHNGASQNWPEYFKEANFYACRHNVGLTYFWANLNSNELIYNIFFRLVLMKRLFNEGLRLNCKSPWPISSSTACHHICHAPVLKKIYAILMTIMKIMIMLKTMMLIMIILTAMMMIKFVNDVVEGYRCIPLGNFRCLWLQWPPLEKPCFHSVCIAFSVSSVHLCFVAAQL